MQFMHSTMGVVHGDLKPLNLLLQQGQVHTLPSYHPLLLLHQCQVCYLVITPYFCSTRARWAYPSSHPHP